MEKRRLANIFLVVFIDLLGFGLILPLIPYYAGNFGATEFVVGLLVAVYALTQFFGAPFLGRLSDRHGRRPILMISIFGTVLSFVMLGLAEPIGTWIATHLLSGVTAVSPLVVRNAAVLGVIFFSRAFAGLTGGNLTVAQAYIADVTDPANRAKGFGLIGAAFGLGFILGPAIGGLLSQFGYGVPALSAAALATVNLLGVYLFLPESLAPERRAELSLERRPLISFRAMWEALTRPRVGPLMNVRLFYSLAAALLQTMFTLWAKDRLGLNAQSTALLLAYIGLLSVLVQGLVIGRLTARFGEAQLIFGASVVQGLSMLAWAFTPSVPVLLVVLIPTAFSSGVLNTVINSAITRVVTPREIGGALGVAASLESFSRIVSPVVGSWMLGTIGTWAPGVAGAVIMLWVSIFARRRVRPALDMPAPSQPAPDLVR